MSTEAQNKILSNVSIEGGCWNWNRCVLKRGYGQTTWGGKRVYAHRLSYSAFVGEITTGMCIDHLCRNRKCVNPEHLELVTNAVNIQRGVPYRRPRKLGSHCRSGHEFSSANTHIDSHGDRICRKCNRRRQGQFQSRRRAELIRTLREAKT